MTEREEMERELLGIIEARTGHRAAASLIPGLADGQAVWMGVASVPQQSWRVIRWPDGRWETRLLEDGVEPMSVQDDRTRKNPRPFGCGVLEL